jgi:ParB family chromosome partitioning protein
MIAGVKTIPAMVRDLTDSQVLEIQTIENIQREDVHPLDEALGYKMLMEQAGYDVVTIAAKVGKHVSYIYQRMKLAELVPAAQKAFFDEKITASHAIHIARLQPQDQAEALRYCTEPHGSTVRQLAEWIERTIHLDLHSAAFKKDDPTLVPEAGSCVQCPKRTGFNEDLFPDIKKKDTCTDHVCFHKKMGTFLDRCRAQLKAEDKEFIEITDGYFSADKKILHRGQWSTAGNKKCKYFKIGLVVEGHEIGSQLKICTSARCTTHHRGVSGSSPSSISGRRMPSSSANYEIKHKARELAYDRAIRRIVDKCVDSGAPMVSQSVTEQLRLVAQILLSDLNYFERCAERICKRRGIEGKPIKKHKASNYHGNVMDYDGALLDAIKEMGSLGLQKLLLDFALDMLSESNRKLWEEILKQYKVDEKKLTAAAEKELKKAAADAKAAAKMALKKPIKPKLHTSAKQKKAA